MAAGRSSKSLVDRRRRVGDDDEEDGPVSVGDSQSEGSVAGGMADDEGVDTVEVHTQQSNGNTVADGSTGAQENGSKQTNKRDTAVTPSNGGAIQSPFEATTDTEAMLRGMNIPDTAQDVVEYTDNNSQATSDIPRQAPVKQKKEHEDYKKQRDVNPAFIPNRGNFFMHDTRGQYNGGPLPFRGQGAGRGRGRGGPVGPTAEPPRRLDRASQQPWKHDLHDAINDSQIFDQGGKSSARLFTRPTNNESAMAAEPVSFSSTTLLGRVQIRVFFPGMPKAITYAEVPLKKYIRLPDHRPPLRRDKPLRISLPDIGPKYIFPATERSFIFIPRQMRPYQRANSNQRNATSNGYGYSSRRTSMYGGSVYSGSIAASRRSSITRDREGMFSPASYGSAYQGPNRPVVRLPRSGHFYGTSTPPMGPFPGQQAPIHQVHTYPLPQQPAFQGTPTTTVQHPRPQKAISVSGIEPPAALTQRQTPADQQPFHSQLPHHLAEQTPSYYSPRQQYAYPVGSITSPLSQIPEQAAGYQQMYPYAQQPYYYGSAPVPMYAMHQQQGYMYPPTATVPQPSFQDVSDMQASGMVAHESNGMVFYMPAAEAAAQPTAAEQYQPAEGFVPTYAVPGLPPTPAPDQSGYFYMQNNGFYQPMQQG